MEREPFPASLLPAPGGSGAFTDPSPTCSFDSPATEGRALQKNARLSVGRLRKRTPGTGSGRYGENARPRVRRCERTAGVSRGDPLPTSGDGSARRVA